MHTDTSDIILGIDPGTLQMGYAVIKMGQQPPHLLSMGTLILSSQKDMYERLQRIQVAVRELIELHTPKYLAIEAPFYSKNVQSMLKLGRAQGIAIAMAMQFGMQVTEYSPRRVKQSVTGNGNASKEQMWKMLQNLFRLHETPKFLDASDALGVAMCLYHQLTSPIPVSAGKKKDWAAFLANNPHKIKK